MFGIENWIAFLLVLMRMMGCILFNPILGRKNFPPLFRIGMALVLALTIYAYSGVQGIVITSAVEYIVLLLKEFIIGYVVGFVVNMVTYMIIFGGEIIDMQMGIAMSKIYDPNSNVSMSLSATYYNILFIFLFFLGNGHLTLIELFLYMERVIPYGQVVINPAVSEDVIEIFCQFTVLAMKFAFPILAIEFLLEMAVGILMKAIPQINVFVVNIQAKLLIGLVLIVVLFSPMVSFFEQVIETLFDAVNTVVITMGP